MASLLFWLVAGGLKSGALWVFDLLKRSELARWLLAAAVVWLLWEASNDRAREAARFAENARWEALSRAEADRQAGVVAKAVSDYQVLANQAKSEAAGWERQAALAEARAAVLAGKSCLPKEVVDAIKDIR